LRRDKARKRLSEIVGLANDESFVIMVWAVDALQSDRADAAARVLSFPKEAKGAKLGDNHFVYKWALETLINELLIARKKARPRKGRTRVLDCSKFQTVATCVNTLRNLEDAEDGMVLSQFTVFDIMHKIGHRQFEWQRGFFSYSQIYRTLTVFGGDFAKGYFHATNGVSIADFFNCGFAFYALSQDHPGFETVVDLSAIKLSDRARDAALKLLSAPLEQIRKQAISIRQTGGRSTAYQQSVLRKTPLILFERLGRQIARAPLPALICQRITTGLYYDLVSGGPDIWREIGSRFEGYCLDLTSAMLPTAKPSGSLNYKFKKRFDSPDLFLHDESGAARVVVECKAKKMSIVAKYSDNPLDDAKEAFSEIIKGVVQLWRFYSHCRRTPEIKLIHPDAIGMLLTLDPWLQMSHHRERVLEEARKITVQIDRDILDEDCRPILFCSIDDFENTLEAASAESLFEAISATSKPEFQGWLLVNVHEKISTERRRNPYPFQGRIAEINPGWAPLGDAEDQAAT
jgi:hypothetical protein